MGWDRFKSRIKRWRIGDFIRQFSIVTAGVMVTFIGSSLITSRSTENQIKSSIQLIIKELEKNVEELQSIRYKYERDRTMAQYLIDSSFRIDNFSIDTLQKYQALTSQVSSFTYSSDALEVFKNSSLMQSIEDKSVLLRIIESYKNLGQVKEGIVEYYDLKKMVIVPLVLESDTSDTTGDVRSTYKNLLSHNSVVSFCRIASGFLNLGYLDAQIVELNSTIVMLRSLYD